ncbi:hypothetical protein EUGRSUZ_F00784 [Eucalyptus grandis]|uniref:Uncharacterized protein n=2 Tax=Eucalyptus grandis TaxID=71139 RepID=A0ACC3KCJ0_EUCGR|nr:hypothetical protein EUGRSUZ_F00784 [Eucalyptus grandis]
MPLTLVHIIFSNKSSLPRLCPLLNPNLRPPPPSAIWNAPSSNTSISSSSSLLPITPSKLSPPTAIPILSGDIFGSPPLADGALKREAPEPCSPAASSAVDGGEEVEVASEAVAEGGLAGVGGGR